MLPSGAHERPCLPTGGAGRSPWTTLGLAALVLSQVRQLSADAAGGFLEDRAYTYRSYQEVLDYFADLKRRCPDIVDTWVAQEEFPDILPASQSRNWAMCGKYGPCRTLVVRVANRALLTDTTPEVFFSGALHGDERLGPLVVTEFAGLLCRGYQAGDAEIRHLVDTRSTWITPMTNAQGFAYNSREENNMDPNRDFPYLQNPRLCMQTQTARTVNELFRRHLFQFELTFHGGMRALTYEWGSRNHLQNRRSTESPDDRAFLAVGQLMQAASGQSSGGEPWYPLGRINDLVYPVDGGMEDWSYAAGWEASPSPITVCQPTTYGGYDPSRTKYRPGSVSALVYLAEMDDAKTPGGGSLGRANLWAVRGGKDGHVARNLRMCLVMLEMARPELLPAGPQSPPGEVAVGTSLAVEVRGVGCMTTSARLLLVPQRLMADTGCAAAPSDGPRRAALLAGSLQVAEVRDAVCGRLRFGQPHGTSGPALQLRGDVPVTAAPGAFCLVAAAEFDQEWGRQSHPDPDLRPRSHAARVRVDEHYTVAASDGPMRIDEYRTKLFPLFETPVQVVASSAPSPAQAAAAQTTTTAAPAVATTPAPTPTQTQTGTRSSPAAAAVGGQAVQAPPAAPAAAGGRQQPPLAAHDSPAKPAASGSQVVLPNAAPGRGDTAQVGLLLTSLAALAAALCLCNAAELWRLAHSKVERRAGRTPRVSPSAWRLDELQRARAAAALEGGAVGVAGSGSPVE